MYKNQSIISQNHVRQTTNRFEFNDLIATICSNTTEAISRGGF